VTTTSSPARRALRPTGRLLPEDTRRHHRALLLQLLFRYGPAGRAVAEQQLQQQRPVVPAGVLGQQPSRGAQGPAYVGGGRRHIC